MMIRFGFWLVVLFDVDTVSAERCVKNAAQVGNVR